LKIKVGRLEKAKHAFPLLIGVSSTERCVERVEHCLVLGVQVVGAGT
jgi:hypothetical protein